MAQLRMETVIPGAAVGVLSGAGQLFEDNVRATQPAPNMFMRNLGPFTDYAVGGFAVANSLMDLNLPRDGARDLAASGITVAARRATTQVGQMILGLRTSVSKTVPSRQRRAVANGHIPAYMPSAEVVGGRLPDGEEILFTQV